MTEDSRTLWIGNIDDRVTEELLYELFLQTGPIERLILPAETEGEEKKHKGHAYVLFQHPESVQYASQVLEGSSLFGHPLALKARALPVTYKKPVNGFGRGRYDSSSLRGGMSKSTTWHGGSDLQPKGRGSYRGGRGGTTTYAQTPGYNYAAYAATAAQMTPGYWMTGQAVTTDATQLASYVAPTAGTAYVAPTAGTAYVAPTAGTAYVAPTAATAYVAPTAGTTYVAPTTGTTLDDKKQRLLQQQSMMMYGMTTSTQQAQQQGMWANGYGATAGTWAMTATGDTTAYAGYTDQYGNWYQQQ